ncbi:uncharacterized protein LOC609916 [Canis lupus familiaris]|uniref:uncharacterized protein LOC609916 n=1 Tax=Canis lupus familiaris TaxID=9615 RepID=UPI0018F3F8E3|nr:uncharacterized protein LOC609916 [Canis lupus familiaris]
MDTISTALAAVCEVQAPRDLTMPRARLVSIRGRGVSPPAHSPRSSTCSQVGWLNQGGPPALSIRAGSIQRHGQIPMLPQPKPEQMPPPETQMPQTKEAMLSEAEKESVLPPLHRGAL